MSKESDDINGMEAGIKRLLGKERYDEEDARPECEHESDGFIYGETKTHVTLLCRLCGVHYEKRIEEL